jgi:hypothetical protein
MLNTDKFNSTNDKFGSLDRKESHCMRNTFNGNLMATFK